MCFVIKERWQQNAKCKIDQEGGKNLWQPNVGSVGSKADWVRGGKMDSGEPDDGDYYDDDDHYDDDDDDEVEGT